MSASTRIALKAVLILVGVSMPHAVWAQPGASSTTSGTSTAVIVDPLAVEVERQMTFGWIDATRTSSVTIRPEEAVQSGGASAAKFRISGLPMRGYQIAVQSGASARGLQSGFTIPVTSIRAKSMNGGSVGNIGKLDSVGRDVVYVGGTVDVDKTVPSDFYSAEVEIFVAYN